ncbi:MAG: XRE family transcriptional regulator [Pseudomonadota bacterium]
MDAQWLKTQFEMHPEKTKAELARALGLEPPAISKIISGTRQIKAPEYLIMREFFGMPVDGQRAVHGENAVVVEAIRDNQSLKDGETPETNWVMPNEIIGQHTQANAEHVKNFQVSDQMMAPEFNKGEHVLVDTSNTQPSPPGTFIVSDGYGYMLRHCEVVAKSEPLQVKISALKSSFQPQKLELDEFLIIGRVIAKLQWL